jgi:hypothetical protein
MLLHLWPLLSRRDATGQVAYQAASAIGSTEDLVAVHGCMHLACVTFQSTKVGMKSSHTFDRSLLFSIVLVNRGLGMLPVLSSCSTKSLALPARSSMPGHKKKGQSIESWSNLMKAWSLPEHCADTQGRSQNLGIGGLSEALLLNYNLVP